MKAMRERSGAYNIVLSQTIEAENYKEDFDLIWNLETEIFNQIDPESMEDIKTQIYRLQSVTPVAPVTNLEE